MARIFVSYRRDDAEGEAGRIADQLHDRFGADDVFFDTALKGGDRWRERIDAALAQCDVMLVIIGRHWLSVSIGGQRRLDLPDDVVAYEVAAGLERRVRVIPVLVQRATLPRADELPPRLRGLTEYQARELRADAFERDMHALLRDIAGQWLLPRRPVLVSIALAVVLAGGTLAWWQPWKLKKPLPPSTAPLTLKLRIKLDPQIDPEIMAVDRMKLLHRLPDPLAPSLLDNPNLAQPGVAEFGAALPAQLFDRGRFEADIAREVLKSAAVRQRPRLTIVCLSEVRLPPQVAREVRLECNEGNHCAAAADNLRDVVVKVCSNGTAAAPLHWLRLASAVAQPLAETPQAAEGWVVPSLQTLRRLHEGPSKSAYTEVELTSPPLPALQAARQLVNEVRVNGTPVWVDGLPAAAVPVAFDAGTGVRLRFGLENLGFSGAQRGYEKVQMVLRFLDAQRKTLQETALELRYIALRDQREPQTVGDPSLGLRWSATYFPGRADDRYQVFLMSSPAAAEVERTKQRFDRAGYTLTRGERTWPLVAVIRPPLNVNPNYGLNVGLREPTGQIRFSLDDEMSATLCRALMGIAAQPGSVVRRDCYRRDIDNARDWRACNSFGAP